MMRAVLALLAALLAGRQAQAGELTPREAATPKLEWQDRDGKTLGPADLGGKLVLVHLWASWCGTCRIEFPAIDALQNDMRGEGLRVAAVSLDRLGWPAIDRTTQSLGVRHVAVFHDLNRELTQALKVAGLPTTVVLDREGREVARLIGAGDWADAKLRDQLRALMRK
jgi:thiol-disulfide isomerase/thioredoxin